MDEFMYEIRCINGQIPLVPFHLSTTHLRFECFLDWDFVHLLSITHKNAGEAGRLGVFTLLGGDNFHEHESGRSICVTLFRLLESFAFSPSKCISNRAAAYCMDGVFFILSDL